MYKLKGKKPELSYNLLIKYDSTEQLSVLESVWGEACEVSYRTKEKGYFGLSNDGELVLVWFNYDEDSDTVLQFLDVFEEANSILPYSAQTVYDMGEEAREERKKNLEKEKKDAIDLFFSKVIIPRTEAGYTCVSFNWCELSGMGLGELFINFTKKEFKEVMEAGGFNVRYAGYYDDITKVNTIDDNTVVRISWYKGE